MRRFGLIGRPLGHSASAAYFAAKFEREGIADCTYTLYELPEIGALERLLAETPDLCGFNVTIPYKREVMALLDDLSHDARLVGAVNACAVRQTHASWDTIPMSSACGPPSTACSGANSPSHALVLGTGGASQAVQYVLASGASRRPRVTRRRKGQLHLRQPAVRGRGAEPPHSQRIARGNLPRRRCPRRESPTATLRRALPARPGIQPALTRFLDLGRQRGARILNGEVMFRRQAEASWRIWNE